MPSARNGRGPTRRERRRARERAIVATARALIDERGRRDVAVDEIARAARLNKALIYRSFDSKEEIFVLTVVDYLAELEARGAGCPACCARSQTSSSTSFPATAGTRSAA